MKRSKCRIYLNCKDVTTCYATSFPGGVCYPRSSLFARSKKIGPRGILSHIKSLQKSGLWTTREWVDFLQNFVNYFLTNEFLWLPSFWENLCTHLFSFSLSPPGHTPLASLAGFFFRPCPTWEPICRLSFNSFLPKCVYPRIKVLFGNLNHSIDKVVVLFQFYDFFCSQIRFWT